MATPEGRTHTDAVVAALVAAGLEAEAGEAPDAGGWQGTPGQSEFTPYAVVFGQTDTLSGPAGAPDDDGELIRQVTYVGSTHEQAEWARDTGRPQLLQGVSVDGRQTDRVALEIGLRVERDDDVEPHVHFAIDHYRIFSFPA